MSDGTAEKKNRDAILFASLFCRSISPGLAADFGVVCEVQVVVAVAIEVNPTLDRGA